MMTPVFDNCVGKGENACYQTTSIFLIVLEGVKEGFLYYVNPFPTTPFWDRPKFKEDVDDNWNVAIKGF